MKDLIHFMSVLSVWSSVFYLDCNFQCLEDPLFLHICFFQSGLLQFQLYFGQDLFSMSFVVLSLTF